MSPFEIPESWLPGPSFGGAETDAAVEELGHCGRMVWGSKSGYVEQFPEGRPVFNANVCLVGGKIWYGDLDLAEGLDGAKLRALATRLGQRVYVLRESDARFANEKTPRLDEAVAVFDPEGGL